MDSIEINGRKIGPDQPTYIVAEVSANHNGQFDRAKNIITAAADSGADAVKLQTYEPDTMTLDSDEEHFQIENSTNWEGRSLYDLYEDAHTPWEWHEDLFEYAESKGLNYFSTAYDPTAVEFLEQFDVPLHKTASFEIVDIPLIRKMAATGRPLVLSTGMATNKEIEEAVTEAREAGAEEIILLKCTSSYPASLDEMDLRTIPDMRKRFGVPVGLSDHSMRTLVPTTAVALGAIMVEKHLTLDRNDSGPDSDFSLEPDEFARTVEQIRETETTLGSVKYGPTKNEEASLQFRRSLFIVEEVQKGETLNRKNVKSIRPSTGLHPRHFEDVLGAEALRDLKPGTPLSWDLIDAEDD